MIWYYIVNGAALLVCSHLCVWYLGQAKAWREGGKHFESTVNEYQELLSKKDELIDKMWKEIRERDLNDAIAGIDPSTRLN